MALRERRVAGEVFLRKGHMVLDWRRTASMVAIVPAWRRHVCGRIEDVDVVSMYVAYVTRYQAMLKFQTNSRQLGTTK